MILHLPSGVGITLLHAETTGDIITHRSKKSFVRKDMSKSTTAQEVEDGAGHRGVFAWLGKEGIGHSLTVPHFLPR